MRPLHPPLKIIEDHLFMPSENLLLRWANNDPSLSQETINALENDPVARDLYADLKNPSQATVIEKKEIKVPPLSPFLKELIEQRIAAREHYASVSAPSPGQIVLIDEIVGPEGAIDWDLPNPLAVLIDEPTKNVWYGWIVASETDYASHWDMLLEPEDQPFDPLAGMIQIWNPVHVYLPPEVSVLAVLKPERLKAVHALAVEFVSGAEPDTSLSCPGHIAPRETVGGYSILTGSPLGGADDPRHHYRKLYHRATEVLREVARSAQSEQVETQSWISAIYHKLKDSITAQKWEVGWAIPAAAMAVIVVLVVSLRFFWPTSFEEVDTTFQTIYAQKTDEMEQGLRDFQFEWEKTNVLAFSSTPSSSATLAFSAGLFTAREALLGESEIILPERLSGDWSKTEWATDFELGRWIFLLWTACQFQPQMPATFWDEQKEILVHFKNQLTDNRVIKKIEPFLPTGNCDNLKQMMVLMEKF